MNSHEPLKKLHSSCLLTTKPKSLFSCLLLHSIGKIWVAVRSSFLYFFLFFFFLNCSLVLISFLKTSKVLEYFNVKGKQLNVATFATVSKRARSVRIGAGPLYSISECSFQTCFSGASILDWFSFPISNTSFPCVSPHFLPVSDSTLSHIHLEYYNLLLSPGRIWRLY